MKPLSFVGPVLLASIILLVGCQQDPEPTPEPMPEPVPQLTECTPYQGTEAFNAITESWTEANQEVEYPGEILIPDDPGGGYVVVELSTGEPATPRLTVDNDLDAGGAILSGSPGNTSNDQVRRGWFSVAPGASFDVVADPFFEPDVYPWEYSLSWTYTSREDCFEPNDSFDEAKAVALDESHEAYAIAGHVDYFVASNAPQTYDWYLFTLDETAIVKAELLSAPSDVYISLRLFRTASETIPISTTVIREGDEEERGALSEIRSQAPLPPGSYALEIHHDRTTRKGYKDDEFPDHFNRPYRFRIQKVE